MDSFEESAKRSCNEGREFSRRKPPGAVAGDDQEVDLAGSAHQCWHSAVSEDSGPVTPVAERRYSAPPFHRCRHLANDRDPVTFACSCAISFSSPEGTAPVPTNPTTAAAAKFRPPVAIDCEITRHGEDPGSRIGDGIPFQRVIPVATR